MKKAVLELIICVCVVFLLGCAMVAAQEIGLEIIEPEPACKVIIILDNKWKCECNYEPYVEGLGFTCLKMSCARMTKDHILFE